MEKEKQARPAQGAGTPQAHGVSFADVQRRIAARDKLTLKAVAARVDADNNCLDCDGTGEGHFDTACGPCRGKGYFGRAA